MTALQTSFYQFHGQAWSLFPPHNNRGLNIVSGVNWISHQIISLCLTRKGEDLMHPDRGLAPDLFSPASDYDPEYLVYHLESEIRLWIAGIQQLSAQVTGYTSIENKLAIDVGFIPLQEPNQNILTFPYYQYQGARLNGDLEIVFSLMASLFVVSSPD
jgi:hypothetical protein